MSCLSGKEFKTVENMSRQGGSFVKALAACFHTADYENKEKLKEAFPDYWTEYSLDKWDNNLTEQARQDFIEDGGEFTGHAHLI